MTLAAGTAIGACATDPSGGLPDAALATDVVDGTAGKDAAVDSADVASGASDVDAGSVPGDSADATAPAPDAAADSDAPPPSRCEQITASIDAAGFLGAVDVTCDGTYAWIGSDTYPAHDKMNGITGTNEQVPVPAVGFRAPIPLVPTLTDAMVTRDNAVAIAVNGVPIYDYTSQGELDPLAPYDPQADVVVQGQLDVCNGHAGRGDDYHYHAAPICLIAAMANAGPEAIIGWAYDGFPLYGDTNPDGTPIAAGTLDPCNGMVDLVFGYRYHTSVEPPYIVKCLRGQFDADILPRVSPLSAATGGGKPPGTPPKGGVQDLVWKELPDGRREMTYMHESKPYFIRYEPAETAGCYRFEMNTVSQGAVTGEYCREKK